jgi:hypothetical protein
MNIVDRLRSPLIALVVLALSATAVFAARTISDSANTSNVGLAQASAASSHGPEALTAKAPDKSSEGADSTTGTDATTGSNHGATVSGAASLSFDALKAACGGNLKNKGAYISSIARGLYVFTASAGKVTCVSAPTTIHTTTPSSPAATTPAKLHGNANADAKRSAHQPQPAR